MKDLVKHHHIDRSRMRFIKVESREALDTLTERYEDVIYLVPHVSETPSNTVEDRYDEYIWITDDDLKPQPEPQPDTVHIIKQFSVMHVHHSPKPVKVDKRGHWELIGEDVANVEHSLENLVAKVGDGFDGATITDKVAQNISNIDILNQNINSIVEVIGTPIVEEEKIVPVYDAIRKEAAINAEQAEKITTLEADVESLKSADTELLEMIETERAERTLVDGQLSDRITEEVATLNETITTKVAEEAEERGKADKELNEKIDYEIGTLATSLKKETYERIDADNDLHEKIKTEKAARTLVDGQLADRITEEVATLNATITAKVAEEAEMRASADTELRTAIENEAATRETADAELSELIKETADEAIAYYSDEMGPLTFSSLEQLEKLLDNPLSPVKPVANRIYLVQTKSEDAHSKYDEYISIVNKRTGEFYLERIGQDMTVVEKELAETNAKMDSKFEEIDEFVANTNASLDIHDHFIRKNTENIADLGVRVDGHDDQIASLSAEVSALQSTELRFAWVDKLPATYEEAKQEGETREQTVSRLRSSIFVVAESTKKKGNICTEYVWNEKASSEEALVFEKVGQVGLDPELIDEKITVAVDAAKEELHAAVDAEETRATAAEAEITAKVSAEETRATAAEDVLNVRCDDIETAATQLKLDIDNEITRSSEKDEEHDLAIAAVKATADTAVQSVSISGDDHGMTVKAEREDNAVAISVSIEKAEEKEDAGSSHKVTLRGENFTTGEQVQYHLDATLAEAVQTAEKLVSDETARATSVEDAIKVDVAAAAETATAAAASAEEAANAAAVAAEIASKAIQGVGEGSVASNGISISLSENEETHALDAALTVETATIEEHTGEIVGDTANFVTAGDIKKFIAFDVDAETARATAAEGEISNGLSTLSATVAELPTKEYVDNAADKAVSDSNVYTDMTKTNIENEVFAKIASTKTELEAEIGAAETATIAVAKSYTDGEITTLTERVAEDEAKISALSSATEFVVVNVLPAEGDSHKIYLLKPEGKSYYEEWVYVLTTGAGEKEWIKLCDAEIELENYSTTEEVKAAIAAAVKTETDARVELEGRVTVAESTIGSNVTAITEIEAIAGTGIHDESGEISETLTNAIIADRISAATAHAELAAAIATNTASITACATKDELASYATTEALNTFETEVETTYAKKSDATTVAVKNETNSVITLDLSDGESGHDYVLSANLQIADFDTINNMWFDADAEKPATSHQIQDFVYEEFRRKGIIDTLGINPVVVETMVVDGKKYNTYSVKAAKFVNGAWDFSERVLDVESKENLNLAVAIDVAAADVKVLADAKAYTDEVLDEIPTLSEATIASLREKDGEAFNTNSYMFKLSGADMQKLLDLLANTQVTEI